MGHVKLFDGDPGSSATRQYSSTKEGAKAIGRLYKGVLDRGWWPYPDVNGVRRMAQAECILPRVDPKYIRGISVKNKDVEALVRRRIGASSAVVDVDPTLFFDTEDRRQITERLSLVRGDMFFSRMQTLTVSVNLKGVMGAGVALRAKLQFPDVYVHYQNCCRRRTIRMGRPGLYQRELPIHYGLSPDAWHSTDSSNHRWFLLFATKTDWRHDSDVEGIKAGLRWIKNNYHEAGITSLAVPALGCGNGNLSWQNMGPILCQELSSLDVPVEIYLPEGRELSDDQLDADYLLTSGIMQ
jgi:O-acetyl-ADP-ribose deacetylase (regulator of RNase III)